jgi:hypothetical protein
MGIADRLYNIAKGHLDRARETWDQIDSAAQRELDEYTGRADMSAFDRAQAKIAALDAQRNVAQPVNLPPSQRPLRQAPPAPVESAPQQTASGRPLATIQAAYQIIGVPPGSDFETVCNAYQQLIDRAQPNRFPEGSAEQAEAQRIERRIKAAYMMLADELSPADDRFDRLEL